MYIESKKKIDKIREVYSSAGDVIFRAALGVLMEHGQELLLNDEWFSYQYEKMENRHESYKELNKAPLVSLPFEKGIIECARDLAAISATEIFMYVQREIWFQDSFDEISYQKATDLLINTVNYALQDRETDIAREDLEYMGFEDSDLCALGFAEVFLEEEE